MTVHTCPRGHASETGDFCDTCGAKIGGTAAVSVDPPTGGTAAPTGGAGPAAGVETPTGAVETPTGAVETPTGALEAAPGSRCPNCGTAQTGRERFCEDCGFDSDTGKVPSLTLPPAPPFGAAPGLPVAATPGPLAAPSGQPLDTASGVSLDNPRQPLDTASVPSLDTASGLSLHASGRPLDTSGRPLDTSGAPGATAGVWTATVTADREYFDANGIEGVDFPAHCPRRSFTLPAPQVRIGRRSTSKGTDPEMDLSAQPLDPGISHSHALLTVNTDGVWLISDLGSTNGTYVNDDPDPLVAGRSRALADGDRVHVGAWTTITLHAPARP